MPDKLVVVIVDFASAFFCLYVYNKFFIDGLIKNSIIRYVL